MKNFSNMMKQAQKLQEQMADAQKKVALLESTGQSGGGVVKISVNGLGEMRSLKIDPSLINPEEIDVLEDLIIAAFHDAKTKVDALAGSEMGKVTEGLSLPPGLSLPF